MPSGSVDRGREGQGGHLAEGEWGWHVTGGKQEVTAAAPSLTSHGQVQG